MKLSILIPVYNERAVVERSLSAVVAAALPENMERELIIVDDRSTDGTWEILERLAASEPRIRLFRHEVNRGKGAAQVEVGLGVIGPETQSRPVLVDGLLQPVRDSGQYIGQVVVQLGDIGFEAQGLLVFGNGVL